MSEQKKREKAIREAITTLEELLSAIDVAKNALGAIEQIRWERDTAIEQLHELGYEFGEAKREGEGHDCLKDIGYDCVMDIGYMKGINDYAEVLATVRNDYIRFSQEDFCRVYDLDVEWGDRIMDAFFDRFTPKELIDYVNGKEEEE